MKSVELIRPILTRCDPSSRLRRGLVADRQILEAALERHFANPNQRDEQDEPANDCGREERRLQGSRELGPAGGGETVNRHALAANVRGQALIDEYAHQRHAQSRADRARELRQAVAVPIALRETEFCTESTKICIIAPSPIPQ